MSVLIGGKRYSWNTPMCERCWCDVHGGEEGPWEQPVRVRDVTGAEQCGFCGYPTWAGIFVRADPRLLLYPALETDG